MRPSNLKNQIADISTVPATEVMKHETMKSAFSTLFSNKQVADRRLQAEQVYFQQLMEGPNSDKLKQCHPVSLVSAVIALLTDGLSLNPELREATIIPYGKNASYRIMYSGKIKILTSIQAIRFIKYCEVVYDCDDIKMNNGIYSHSPKIIRPDNAKKIGALLIAIMPDGSERHVFLRKDNLDKRKSKSKMQGVWNEWEDEMWKKSLINELFKFMPKSSNNNELLQRVLSDKEEEDEEEEIPYSEIIEDTEEGEYIEESETTKGKLSKLLADYGMFVLTNDQLIATINELPDMSEKKVQAVLAKLEVKIDEYKNSLEANKQEPNNEEDERPF